MSILSYVKALDIAIESVNKRDDLPLRTKNETVDKLTKLKKRDWYNNWTKESIIKALNDYKQNTGCAPTTTNLKEIGMPSGAVISSYFHVTPSLFLKALFPENRNLAKMGKRKMNCFGYTNDDDWLNCLRTQFNKHSESIFNNRDYNKYRDENTPTWETIARNCNIGTWTELMNKAELKYVNAKPKTARYIYMDNIQSPFIDKIDKINKERKQLQDELIQILNNKKTT